jgi:UDP-glucose 4-epimerase
MKILVTGGCGYIGSHSVVELVREGFDVVIVDNQSNSKKEVVQNISMVTGQSVIEYHNVDLRDIDALRLAIGDAQYACVVHFAALKSIPESFSQALEYYDNNICGTVNLLRVMKEKSIDNIIFSSSASIYGENNVSPFKESCSLSASNPYAQTKIYIEKILSDTVNSGDLKKAINLRYFNPVGAHPSGLLGENPLNLPTNIMPVICRVASKKQSKLNIFGGGYSTHDGTGVRDYIHIEDLALGHVCAVKKVLLDQKFSGVENVNLGTGIGYSVLDLVHTFEKVNSVLVPYEINEKRKGDIAVAFADPSHAFKFLSWKPKKNLEDMCRDAWRWINQNENMS